MTAVLLEVQNPVLEVQDPVAPLRRAPRDDAALETQALLGERVELLDVPQEGWVRARLLADGYEGWLPDAALGKAGPASTHLVRAPRSFLFPAPDFKRPPVGALTIGAAVRVVGQEGDYARLDTGAFIARSHLVEIGRPGGHFVAIAETLLHVPYLWGGKSGLGIDCSGLVQLSLALTGVAAPRDSGPQGHELGVVVAEGALPTDIRRGDLLFWKDHVAIARDDITMIHANVHHMAVAIEDMRGAIARIAAKDNPLLRVRRLGAGV